MTYIELLELCKNYDRIVVSGPQRSGTTFATADLSMELKYKRVDEQDFGIHRFESFYEKLRDSNVVIQCPALTHKLDEIDLESTLVIFMMRDDDSIYESEKRINWVKEFDKERNKYITKYFKLKEELLGFDRNSKLKKWVWSELQRDAMKVDWVEVDYTTLKDSVRWISKDNRASFKPKQIY